jgi:hypothetical protein
VHILVSIEYSVNQKDFFFYRCAGTTHFIYKEPPRPSPELADRTYIIIVVSTELSVNPGVVFNTQGQPFILLWVQLEFGELLDS